MTLPGVDPAERTAPAVRNGLPDLQLLDRSAGRWVEFPHPQVAREMRIVSPERYLDASGALRARFVNRSPQDGAYFSAAVRIEGTPG